MYLYEKRKKKKNQLDRKLVGKENCRDLDSFAISNCYIHAFAPSLLVAAA